MLLALSASVSMVLALSASGVGDPDGAKASPPGTTTGILSAYFGIDNDLPFGIGFLCQGSGEILAGRDGLPVVLSHRIDEATLDRSDFEVVTASGVVSTPLCVTLNPADDPGEERTVLLIGEFGDADDDPPAIVRIVDELITLDGVDLSETAGPASVTPLGSGPRLIRVERVDAREVGAPAGTTIALRAIWDGGVVAIDGDELDPADWGRYRLQVQVSRLDGRLLSIAPFAIADLDDGDNNHLLFFDVAVDAGGDVRSLSMPADVVIDPNHDPNPATRRRIVD